MLHSCSYDSNQVDHREHTVHDMNHDQNPKMTFGGEFEVIDEVTYDTSRLMIREGSSRAFTSNLTPLASKSPTRPRSR